MFLILLSFYIWAMAKSENRRKFSKDGDYEEDPPIKRPARLAGWKWKIGFQPLPPFLGGLMGGESAKWNDHGWSLVKKIPPMNSNDHHFLAMKLAMNCGPLSATAPILGRLAPGVRVKLGRPGAVDHPKGLRTLRGGENAGDELEKSILISWVYIPKNLRFV